MSDDETTSDGELSPRLTRKRDEILDAATEAFRNEGYEAASMDRIAELAGASKRTVYNHFGSKEALFQAVFARLVDTVHGLQRFPYDPAAPLDEQLTRFARTKSVLAEDPGWHGLLRTVLGVFIHQPALVIEAMLRAKQGERALQDWLSAAAADGRLRIPDVARAADLFWNMVSGALFWPQLFMGALPAAYRDSLIEDIVETFLCRYRAPQDDAPR
ncbi:MAG: TetR/AcrR family transcriptional regulator [Deltaproteobacteria bacterium]|nr:TetR/AcrR family transcriptional regulator [Deltaproteobacteria bacterium]